MTEIHHFASLAREVVPMDNVYVRLGLYETVSKSMAQ